MSRPATRCARFQRGVAAVELAFILPVLVVLLAFPLYFGRVFWHYTAAQKAAQDAARYLSSVPLIDMKDPLRVGHAVAVARDIAEAETAELNPGPYRPSITVLCDGLSCAGFSTPTTVRVGVQLYMVDYFFYGITSVLFPDGGLALTADVTVHYVGR